MLQPVIEYEDDYLMVLNKPSGWIVNDSATVGNNDVLQKWLIENFQYEIANSVEERSGIVHRLDKETSGALIVAKTKEAFYLLQTQFKEREVKKSYLALCHGRFSEDKGVVSATVGRLPWNRERFGVLSGGRESETGFEVKSYYKKDKDEFTLVQFYPKTGRTHQIRIHAKFLNHPLVSDTFYAGRKTSRKDRTWCPRLFLHAVSIDFTHPVMGHKVKVETTLAEDLQKVLNSLEMNR